MLKRILPVFFLFFFSAAEVFFPGQVHAQKPVSPPVDVVFCLDLSSSTNGLIDHFRNHLWDYWYMVARQCKPRANLRIGFVAYSRFSYGKATGYSKVIRDLTTDFEPMSSTIFRIQSRIEKGDQYVGAALATCLKKINWSKNPNALKVIFLIGNGDVTLGQEDVNRSIEKILAQGIILKAIYCSVPGEKRAMRGWQRIAEKSGTKLESILIKNKYYDRLNGFDMQKFRALNKKFNNTYLYYGVGGRQRYKMLNEEDNHIYVTNTEGFRYRSMYKISEDYQQGNFNWDLVDLYYKNPVAFKELDWKTMNDSCKKMTNEQLKAYIIFKKYERRKLIALITDMLIEKELKDKEDGIVSEKRMPTMDIISIRTLKELMRQKGITCN